MHINCINFYENNNFMANHQHGNMSEQSSFSQRKKQRG